MQVSLIQPFKEAIHKCTVHVWHTENLLQDMNNV